MKKKILSVVLTAALLFSTGCGAAAQSQPQPQAPAEDAELEKAVEDVIDQAFAEDEEEEFEETDGVDLMDFTGSLSMSVNNADGQMNILRAETKSTPMGDPGTWTIFVYLCGTDLESSGQASATSDVLQMCEAKSNENVRFVIQTGGTEEWMNEVFDPSMCERYVVENNDVVFVDSVELTSMGDPATLSNFLNWGVENYPAEKMGVIFWNHGSGSLNGVCFDEVFDRDSLSLSEINQAFTDVYANMTDQFEFVGFDCCLMGTLETANMLATYARYFFGSEEIEPGSGWDYTAIGNFLAENPTANGADLGKVVADSFYEECKLTDEESGATFTIMDLSLVDELVIAFNNYANSLFEAAETDLVGIVREILNADNFGGNNKSEGYTNMVDLGGIVKLCSDYVDGTELLNALKNSIVYNINGSTHSEASGLAIYYPLQIQGSDELRYFSEICVSPYYLSLVDMVAQGYSEDAYSNEGFFSEDGEWYSEDMYSDYYDEDYFGYADDNEATESTLIGFAEPPHLDENGVYSFTLDETGLEYTATVRAYIYMYVDDDITLELGETDDIHGSWETGEFSDNFDGYWLSLPSEQLLPTYLVDFTDEYTVMTSPILLNGERTNLRVRQYLDYSIVIEGAWDGIDENGAAAREIRQINPGDVITPIYYLDDGTSFEGDSYTWQEGDNIIYTLLPAGDYLYGFGLEDVYGDYYVSDFTLFTINEDGSISYTDLADYY